MRPPRTEPTPIETHLIQIDRMVDRLNVTIKQQQKDCETLTSHVAGLKNLIATTAAEDTEPRSLPRPRPSGRELLQAILKSGRTVGEVAHLTGISPGRLEQLVFENAEPQVGELVALDVLLGRGER